MRIFFLTLFIFNILADEYPIKEIKLNVGQKLNYDIDYSMDINMNFDTISIKMPSSINMLMPLEVVSKNDSNYIIKLNLNDIKGQMDSQEPMTGQSISMNFQDILNLSQSSNSITQALSKQNDFIYHLDKKGIFTQQSTTSLNPAFSRIFDSFSMYSGGYFVIIPDNQGDRTWTKKFKNSTNMNGMNINFTTLNKYEYVGVEEFNGAEYLKVNFSIDDISMDMNNPMIKMMNVSMDSEITGYYLVQKETGITQYQFTNGKVIMRMDMNNLSNSFSNQKSGSEYDPSKVMNTIMNIQSTMILK